MGAKKRVFIKLTTFFDVFWLFDFTWEAQTTFFWKKFVRKKPNSWFFLSGAFLARQNFLWIRKKCIFSTWRLFASVLDLLRYLNHLSPHNRLLFQFPSWWIPFSLFFNSFSLIPTDFCVCLLHFLHIMPHRAPVSAATDNLGMKWGLVLLNVESEHLRSFVNCFGQKSFPFRFAICFHFHGLWLHSKTILRPFFQHGCVYILTQNVSFRVGRSWRLSFLNFPATHFVENRGERRPHSTTFWSCAVGIHHPNLFTDLQSVWSCQVFLVVSHFDCSQNVQFLPTFQQSLLSSPPCISCHPRFLSHDFNFSYHGLDCRVSGAGLPHAAMVIQGAEQQNSSKSPFFQSACPTEQIYLQNFDEIYSVWCQQWHTKGLKWFLFLVRSIIRSQQNLINWKCSFAMWSKNVVLQKPRFLVPFFSDSVFGVFEKPRF